MEDFSFIRDFKKINWGDTLTYNFMRGSSAGLIIGFIIAMNSPQQSNMEYAFLQMPLIIATFMVVVPLVIIIIFIPYNAMLGFLDRIPGGGALFFLRIIGILSSVVPAMGDPMLRILHSYYPKLVAIEKPGWFQTRVIIFVLR